MARIGGKGMTRKRDRIQKNANKYIVRNCPSICFGKLCSKPFLSYALNCQDCTDCVIKQVIEKVQNTCRKRCTNNCLGTKKHCGYGEILQLFDIEEINK